MNEMKDKSNYDFLKVQKVKNIISEKFLKM